MGGGLGDNMSIASYDSNNFYGRIFFEMAFFMVINIIFLNVVFGIIVDTFSQLRGESGERCILFVIKKNRY